MFESRGGSTLPQRATPEGGLQVLELSPVKYGDQPYSKHCEGDQQLAQALSAHRHEHLERETDKCHLSILMSGQELHGRRI